MSESIKILPTVALRGLTILPNMIVHFDISRDRSIQAVEDAMMQNQEIFLITQRDIRIEEPGIEGLYEVGLIAEVKKLIKMPSNIIRVLVEGKERARLVGLKADRPALYAEIETFPEDTSLKNLRDNEISAMVESLKDLFFEYAQVYPRMPKDLIKQVKEIGELEPLLDNIINNIPLPYEEKQKLLEAVDIKERYALLTSMLVNEAEVAKIKNVLQKEIKDKIDENQREYVLREQLKIIKDELGEDGSSGDADRYEKELEKLAANDEVKAKIAKEIKRFKSISSYSTESGVVRGYIETLLEMPWDKESVDNKNLSNAEKILDEDHYGLDEVKERIIEYLAVRNLTKSSDSPIICLVGPPGTGKTSIAKSVARALEKEYIRISLGGVRDEAEIRGHRRTYVGAMPGRIATGIKEAGVKNPLMLLDEIDKVSNDYKGDTFSALLEVLDGEQNVKFHDHYIEIPIDLSQVLFIATANSTQNIPRPLLDRMEIIEVSSYTENEKVHIAQKFLIKKQIAKHGLTAKQLVINKGAVTKMIRCYTKEAGVRNLERKIGVICRKSARRIIEGGEEKISVTSKNLSDFLGKEKFRYEMANKKPEVGIVRGLAWTSVGGDTLEIEVCIMPGKGKLELTGQMGDVMTESAKAGLSYVRSIVGKCGIKPEFFQENDIHVHIPEGAVPKDGPSAGITMATALYSAITKKKVRADVAMTGEITLTGRVLPIGGLKEKILAAKNANIKLVLVPEKNRPDVEEISSEITDGITIEYVSAMKEVLDFALV